MCAVVNHTAGGYVFYKTPQYHRITRGNTPVLCYWMRSFPFAKCIFMGINPCTFIHDADSAAVAELWASPGLKDGVYLSVSRHLGAAIIRNGKILTGKHGHNATVEHIQMKADGAVCYCGKRGCMETLCSLDALLRGDETPDIFFVNLRAGTDDHMQRWNKFLSDLASAINMIHLVYDTDFVIGGYLAPYLREDDITFLYQKIRQMTPFTEEDDFLSVSKMPEHNITIGAALPYIQGFLA